MDKIQLVQQQARRIPQNDNAVIHIADVARTCYQSFDKSSVETDQRLFEILGEKNHTAMYEHYVAYFFAERDIIPDEMEVISPYVLYEDEYIAINLRTLFEHKNLAILENLFDQISSGTLGKNEFFTQVPKTEVPSDIWSTTVRCTTNRGISHELVRHRKASFAQESTRYCAYREYLKLCIYSQSTPKEKEIITNTSDYIYRQYLSLIAYGVSAQQARDILPHATAVDIVITMPNVWWKHFFSLREAPAAHPMMRELAGMIRKEIQHESTTNFFT